MNFPIAVEVYFAIEEDDGLDPARLMDRKVFTNQFELDLFIEPYRNSKLYQIAFKSLTAEELGNLNLD